MIPNSLGNDRLPLFCFVFSRENFLDMRSCLRKYSLIENYENLVSYATHLLVH